MFFLDPDFFFHPGSLRDPKTTKKMKGEIKIDKKFKFLLPKKCNYTLRNMGWESGIRKKPILDPDPQHWLFGILYLG
jgi:hypothetical protein